ncbi:MAG: ABC transporter substrate-binding protein [Candidatus Eremiobacteraeota bacterium]|nr:ABC transporter substrate-binding protein [Candidatus Eremiobacteraeota bacterium]MBV8367150.1 ABC transporter substrate-binding protein [Candidatus Eremiobacteraeota bacterium]
MRHHMKRAVVAIGAFVLCTSMTAAMPAPAGAENPVIIAVVNDQSKVYADLSGQGTVAAVHMAVEDYGGAVLGRSIKVLSVDHQNDPALGANKAHELYEQDHVDAIFDVPTSSVALAVAGVAGADHKILFVTTGGTDALNMGQCNKYTFHYGYDTYALAQNTGKLITEQGGKRWYMITANYAFGQSMLANFSNAVKSAGGEVIHNDMVPFPNTDFSSYLINAQAMNPQVIGLMNAGDDTVNAMKQINEFGIKKRMEVGIGLLFESDIAALGPDYWSGSTITVGSYWNLDDKTRAWAARYKKRTGKMPTWVMMGNYSAVTQYLDAVARAKTDDADAVVKQLEGYKFEDVFARHAYIRAQDHLLIHDMYVAKIKPASQVKEPYDFLQIVKTVPGEDSYRPLSAVTCHL